MWTGQKLLHVIFSCKMLQIADGHNSGHTELTAAGPERRRQLWRGYNVGDYCRVSPDVMSRTCWRRESGENVRWTAERRQRGPGLWRHLLFLTSRAPDLGPLETVYRAGQAGQVRSEADLFGSDFVLECLRTALWCLYCGWWQSGSAEVENLFGKPSLWWC